MDPSNKIQINFMAEWLELTSLSLPLCRRTQLRPPWLKLQQPLYLVILKEISPAVTFYCQQKAESKETFVGVGVLTLINSQVMVRRKSRRLCVQPCPPPLCCRCSFWVFDISHVAQFLLSVQSEHIRSLSFILTLLVSFKSFHSAPLSDSINKRWEAFTDEEVISICNLTCNLANTPDLWLPKPYVCSALSSSSEHSLYTSCSTCQSNSSSSSSSPSPVLSLHPIKTLTSYG